MELRVEPVTFPEVIQLNIEDENRDYKQGRDV